ncbi:MAG TPA: AraC family transcriptional regulator [Albitalea sp.]
MHAPALGWMDVDATLGSRHLGLPSDLYLITAYCGEGLVCGEVGEECELEVMVTSLRTRPARFHSLGQGQLALALLTPIGALSVLRTPLADITDRRLPLEHFCGRAEQLRLRGLLMSARTTEQRMHALGGWIESRALGRRSWSRAESRVTQAAAVLQQHPGEAPSANGLASALAVTRRQLERDFRKWTGVSLGGYARLVRFQRAAAAVAEGSPLLNVAMACGFADQPHLTRTIREFASVTPRELRLDAAKPGRAAARAALAGRVLTLDIPHASFGSACPSSGPQGVRDTASPHWDAPASCASTTHMAMP